MGFKCGIVGLPNVGKSTLFNALTNSSIDAENYPFCTIDPNIGIVPVPDSRLEHLARIVSPKRVMSATMEFVDIAGLVEGASKGEGLGNKFLANIRETHAIAQVVRCFDDDDIVHVSGKIDPLADIEIINTELCLADQDSLDRALQKVYKIAKSGDKDARRQVLIFEKTITHLDAGKPIRSMDLVESEFADLYPLHLLTQKPTLYIANVEEEGIRNNRCLKELKMFATGEGSEVIPVCATIESEIAELEDESKLEFLQELGLAEPGLNRIIRAGYILLNLHTYFTAGVEEVRAWTLHQGDLAPRAAAVIHTDFAKGFIRAEVISYEDFIEHQGEQGAKNAGKWRLEGKEYIVQDGDVMHFRFNV